MKQRLAFISRCADELEGLSHLPKSEFMNSRNAASAESYLRRSLEAILDVGRHILTRNGGADMALEYKGIAQGLGKMGIVTQAVRERLMKMAGYRNRLVHLYHQVSDEELYEIISTNLQDIRRFEREIFAYVTQGPNVPG
ncbi:MAG: type VII toxin-antitoxin system HepT family RNase toxin [Ignavibacteriales bacterium]